MPRAAVFILIHSVAITFILGRVRSRSFAFIYTRGFSRDVLWLHKMLASVVSVFVAWLRRAFDRAGRPKPLQDWFRNPVSADHGRKGNVRRVVLAVRVCDSAADVSLCLWIRKAQPTRSPGSGMLLAVGLFFTGLTLVSFSNHAPWFVMLCGLLAAVMIATCTISGFLLHRTLEVQK